MIKVDVETVELDKEIHTIEGLLNDGVVDISGFFILCANVRCHLNRDVQRSSLGVVFS